MFDIAQPGKSRALGLIPTGWYPTSVRVTPDGRRILVTSARGLTALPNPDPVKYGRTTDVRPAPGGPHKSFPYIGTLYPGSLRLVEAAPEAGRRPRRGPASLDRDRRQLCRPAPPPGPGDPANPVPTIAGGATPLRYVIYIIKENRTYDEVFGDIKQGNGDPALCLFPEARPLPIFIVWRGSSCCSIISTPTRKSAPAATNGAWAATPPNSSSVRGRFTIAATRARLSTPAKAAMCAAVPSVGLSVGSRDRRQGQLPRLWGIHATGEATPQDPTVSNLPALRGHVDPLYRELEPWATATCAARSQPLHCDELHRFEAAGDMPRLQILRPAATITPRRRAPARSPPAPWWRKTTWRSGNLWSRPSAIPVSGLRRRSSLSRTTPRMDPTHVDAHRTEALVISPYVPRTARVDSTGIYHSCSMQAGHDGEDSRHVAHVPVRRLGKPDAGEFQRPTRPDSLLRRSSAGFTGGAQPCPHASRGHLGPIRFFPAKEDAIDDQTFNRVIWAAMRGENSVMPAPVHAAFVRSIKMGRRG